MPATAYVAMTFEFQREGDQWLGQCLELGTATFGDTVDEVADELADLVQLHLNSLEDVGERERFFERQEIPVFLDRTPQKVTRPLPINAGSVFTQVRPIAVDAGTQPQKTALA
ncbi:MAG: hypothetical protein OXI70_02915 [Chloroflexota bacterium]|nr:hypothetical protein [Gammaproteobacteria bacterium]MDE2767026.1 hypothetical protein [Chloroflexota bacterium]